MTILVLILIFILAGFLLGYGDGGRGSQSRNISSIAGIISLGGIVFAFVDRGIVFALISVVASFIISGMARPIGMKLVAKQRNRLYHDD